MPRAIAGSEAGEQHQSHGGSWWRQTVLLEPQTGYQDSFNGKWPLMPGSRCIWEKGFSEEEAAALCRLRVVLLANVLEASRLHLPGGHSQPGIAMKDHPLWFILHTWVPVDGFGLKEPL